MSLQRNQILIGDALDRLRQLPSASVDQVLTSPPYFRLRSYDVTGQLGLEDTVDHWVERLLPVLREVGRVLLPTGSLWLNLGDSYATHPREGAARKSLLLGPERLALRLLADGWLLRNKIVWQKANPVPSPVRDRLTSSYELIYVLVRAPRYFFDLDSIRLPAQVAAASPAHRRASRSGRAVWRGPNANGTTGLDRLRQSGRRSHPLGKNPADVWRIASSNYRGGHHATFPLELARRAILAGSPEARCTSCYAPWTRRLLRAADGTARRTALGPTCDCAAERESAIVLDPFFGAGTTGLAAGQLGRDWLGIELNPAFARLADTRLNQARASPPRAHG